MNTSKVTSWAQTWAVAKWEFMHFFKLKQEIVSKLVMLGIAVLVYLFAARGQNLDENYAIATDAPFTLSEQSPFQFTQVADASAIEAQIKQEEGEYVALLLLTGDAPRLVTKEKDSWHTRLLSEVETALAQQRFNELALTPSQIQGLSTPININHDVLDERFANQTDKRQTMTAFGVLIVMLIAVFMIFAQLFVSITGEKQNRVTEQLMATMTVKTWMDGKLIGQILLALKNMFTVTVSIVLSFLFFSVVVGQQAVNLNMVDWSLTPWFVVFALLGLGISAAFMAAIAAAIDDPNHSGKGSLMLLPIVPLIIAFFIIDAPDSLMTQFLSMFPLTAFAVMPVRMSVMAVPLWEIGVALVLSCACFFYLRTVAARIFKLGMNMYGKEPSIKAMLKTAIKD